MSSPPSPSGGCFKRLVMPPLVAALVLVRLRRRAR